MSTTTTPASGENTQKDDNNKKARENEKNNSSISDDDGAAARKAAHGTLYNIVLRLFSFLCTQQAFKMLGNDIDALGKASIQLELLLTTTLFIGREGFRLSFTRDLEKDNWNVAWITIPVSTCTACLAFFWHLHHSGGDDTDFQMGGILYCLAAWIEGLAEPAVLHCLRELNIQTRVSAEGAATLCKTFVTILALKRWLPTHWPVFALGVAQLSYAVIYSTYLYWNTWSVLKLPVLQKGLDARTCYLTAYFTIQGLFKHLLTEGDKIVLSTLSGSYDQGIYAMGSGTQRYFLLSALAR